jgi:hypothetical protein
MLTLRLAAVSILTALSAYGQGLPDADKTTETRRHWVLPNQKGQVLYTVTEVVRANPSEDSRLLLVQDDRRNSYLVSKVHSYFDNEVRFEVKDLKRETGISSVFNFPYEGRTRDEFLAAAKKNPGLAQNLEVTVLAGGVTKTARESEWRDAEVGRDLRSGMREGLDQVFLESLERMRGTLLTEVEFAEYCSGLVGFVLHRESCESASGSKLRHARPDCLFDAGFGFACSDQQKATVAQAIAEKRPIESY